jgi:cytochrome c-type biogenesis protein CcmE
MMCRAVLLALTVSVLISAIIVHAADTSVKAILENPSRYDGQEVTVIGMASEVKATVSRRGNPYTTLRLTDASGAAMTVYSQGHPNVKSGDAVQVTGTFQQVKQVGRYTFYNQIDASSISNLEK